MGKKGWVAGRTPGGGGAREGAEGAWATEAGAKACEQQGRDGSPALGARVTRVVRPGLVLHRREGTEPRWAARQISVPRTWASSRR